MSKICLIALFCIFSLLFANQYKQPQWYLLKFGEDEKIWVSHEQKKYIDRKSRPYMDITFFQDEINVKLPPISQLPSKLAQQSLVRRIGRTLSQDNLTNVIKKLSSYHNRYYNGEGGLKASLWLMEQYKQIIDKLPPLRKRFFKVELFPHSKWLQPTVIATIKGTSKDEQIRNEVTIIGAHVDSINAADRENGRAPGADDDASGTATVLEVFRAIAESDFLPERTLQFMGYAAEEVGLWGSQEVAREYRRRQIPVYAVLQLDMTGYNFNNENTMGLIQDYVDLKLANFTGMLIDEYTSLKYNRFECGYGCSDHAAWHEQGYRAIYPPSRGSQSSRNPNIHTPNDTIDTLDLKRAMNFVRIALGFAIELTIPQQ